MLKTQSKNPINFFFIFSILVLCSCNIYQTEHEVWLTHTPTLAPELMDRSWLSDQPCRAPCWYGLTLKTTSKSDARKKVISLPFIDPNNIKEEGNYLVLYCNQPKNQVCAVLYFNKSDHLIKISMVPNFPIKLKKVKNMIGPPDLLYSGPLFGNDCIVKFLWVKRQLEIDFFEKKPNICETMRKNGNKPSPSLPVGQVWYLPPQEFIDLGPKQGYYPWTGFAEEK